ncbi:MAG TPA: gamma-glutamyltransferase [Burkholderiales bacterium]
MRRVLALLVVLIVLPASAAPQPPAAAVATAHPLATSAALEILRAGGNAFDAAVAAAAALAVVEPFSSGIGGGGFFLLHQAATGREVMIDARERAPLAARADMYLDAGGRPIPRASLDGPLAAAIPGLPAALAHLAEHYGALPLARSLAPAIRLARDGFAVTPRYRRMAEWRREALVAWGAGEIFLDGGRVPAEGHVVRQPDLARTLERLAAKGAAGFYRGETARRLVEGVRAAGGIWTLEDLAQYRVIEREPVRGRYRGARIVTAPPPSAGGVMLLEILGMLERYDLGELPFVERTHLVIEAMRRAYGDRALYLGDPDFIGTGGAARLLDPQRIARLAASIDRRRATPSAALSDLLEAGRARGEDTTHLSILDAAGNRVAATLSINLPFGAAFVPPGTGVVLNNEMDDFASGPGIANAYGLFGGAANAIAPGKRPLSSMTPTFVESSDAVAVLGTPGGSRITTMVLLAVLDFVHRRGSVHEWVARPRYHHQYLPDEVQHEPDAFTPKEQAALERRGHRLRSIGREYGNMQALVWDRAADRVEAASDPRGEGKAAVVALRAPRTEERATGTSGR